MFRTLTGDSAEDVESQFISGHLWILYNIMQMKIEKK